MVSKNRIPNGSGFALTKVRTLFSFKQSIKFRSMGKECDGVWIGHLLPL